MKERVLEKLLATPSLKETPRVLVDLAADGGTWAAEATPDMLGGTRFLHVVVFQGGPFQSFQGEVFQFFSDTLPLWNPEYLLLVNVGLEATKPLEILEKECFKGIRNKALVTQLGYTRGGVANKGHMVKLYTSIPFNRTSKLMQIGAWNDNTDNKEIFPFTSNDVFPDRFPSFDGYEFQIASWFLDDPYLYQKPGGPEGVGAGVVAQMLEVMGRVLDFKYNFTSVPVDYNWGSLINGSWTGLLGMVARGEKNFTVNTLTVTEERARDFDTSVSFHMEGFSFILKTPSPLEQWRGLYYSLSSSVWLALLITFVITAAVTSLMVS